MTALADPPPSPEARPDLMACPTCDMLYRVVPLPPDGRLRCHRCHTVLMTNRSGAIDRTLAGAFSTVILMIAAVFFPFLELSAVGLHRNASLIDAALAFSGAVAPLSIATFLLIVVLPVIRAVALAWTLLPLRLGRPPARGAVAAFRTATHLKPWAMAEVFLIGVVVALVKVGGIATIDLGPAFWAMSGLVILVVFEGATLSEWSIWQTLDRSRR